MHPKSIARTTCILLLLIAATLVKPVDTTTWSVNVTRVTTAMEYDGFPVVTQMKDGKIWIVWSTTVASNLTLFYKNSSDLGTTWSDEMNLTRLLSPGNNQNPTVIQAENGTIWLAWTSDRPAEPSPPPPPSPDFYLNATPASLTIPLNSSDNSTISITSINNLTDIVTLSASPILNVTSVLDPFQVFVPTNGTTTANLTVSVEDVATPGNYTLTITGNAPNYKLFRTLDIALEITDATASPSSTFGHTSSQSAADTEILDYEIFFKTSHDNGATWSSDIQLTDDSTDDLRPSIIQLTNGTIMLVWQSPRLGNHDIFYMTSNGTSWSDPKQITTDPGPDKGPQVTQTKDNRIWVAWASRRNGDYKIFYKTYNGSSWSDDTQLTYDSTRSDSTPSILQTIDDTIWIFWTSSTTTGDNDIYFKCSTDNGVTWSASPIQFTTDGNEDMWSAITQARDTKIWVVWVSNRADQPDGNWDIYYKTSLAGDLNENGEVDVFDLAIIGAAFGSREGQPRYNIIADITRDGIVDLRDLAIVSFYYGET